MILRLLISLLLTLGFTDTSANVASTVQLGPEYQTEWVLDASNEVKAYPYYLSISEGTASIITTRLSERLANQLSAVLFKQQRLKQPVFRTKLKAHLSLYPSEEPLYCLLA